MSIQHCFFCDKNIDTDRDVEHFNEQGKCISPKRGIDYYGREFYVAEVPAYSDGSEGDDVLCRYCNCKLNDGDFAISDNGYPDSKDWFCSYDCVNEKITEWDRVAEDAMDREKVERRTGNHWTQRASDKAQLDKFK